MIVSKKSRRRGKVIIFWNDALFKKIEMHLYWSWDAWSEPCIWYFSSFYSKFFGILVNIYINIKHWPCNPYSKVVGSLCVYVFVCVWLNNSGTAGPIWLNFILLALSWSQGGFRSKEFRIWFFRKFGKIRFLGYYLTNLAEIFKIYSTWPKYALT